MTTTRPTYQMLAKRVKELEDEVRRLKEKSDLCSKKAIRYREAEAMALLGHWELDLVRDTLHWSDEIYRMFDLRPESFRATYQAFLVRVHPDDRAFVDKAYSDSVVNRTGYDIVHRLLLEDGTVKYVNERCKTEYDEDGTPIRSMGTVQDITERIHVDNSFCGMIGRDPAMQEVFESVSDFAAVDAPVLILGESGTGKELVASAIHKLSVRASKPFVPVNCGALPEGVIESELFGHVKGAFTGAIRDKKGRFQLADGGTLFLDEVADLPKSVQVKLLRVLQEGTFEPVGGEESVSVDVRIISAANRDLAAEVEAGNFREDLYYRTRVVPIFLPPLRRRKSDIPILIQHFIEKAANEGYRTKGILDDAVAAMIDYPWPGNIRELQSAVQYALIKSKGDFISRSHLPKEVVDHEASEEQSSARFSTQPAVLTDMVGNFDIQKPSRKKLTHQSVMQAIDQCRGNKLKAAKQLGVGRATLYRFLKTNKLES